MFYRPVDQSKTIHVSADCVFVFDLVDKTILLLRLNNKVIPFCDIVSCSSN